MWSMYILPEMMNGLMFDFWTDYLIAVVKSFDNERNDR